MIRASVSRTNARRIAALVGAALTLSTMVTVGQTANAAGRPATRSSAFRPSCAQAEPGRASCMSQFRVMHASRDVRAAAQPVGLTPADVASAYRLHTAPASGAAVAIVDAFDDPNAEADLGVYRNHFGLPPCTTSNGCFSKVNQDGAAAPLPSEDQGWGMEISLDLDAVSAACPTCHILLVEGNSQEFDDLGASVDTAVRLGATVVSNSYGASESAGMADSANHWSHPGTSIVASSGDGGFSAASFPAVLSNTIAVGGTTLTKATGTSRGWKEKAWSGAGSGCSAYIPKPSWQRDKHCHMRTVADISADADTNTGLAVYDTDLSPDQAGFLVGGGTSQSAPLIAAMIARSGRILSNASRIYAHNSALYDPVRGSNGYCGGDYLCTGKPGYDAPTGMGTPHGTGAL
jgi:subtilase family serine protease